MTRARATRGAAVVETALGVTVLVTVILFGVHFSEVMWVAMKAQEATAAAKWDATSMRIHRLPGDYRPAALVPERAAQLTTQRYRDFDGRTLAKGRTTQTFSDTGAGNLEVQCDLATDVRFPQQPLPARLAAVYQDVGGIRCTTEADAWLLRVPRMFAERTAGGNFQAKHVSGADRYHACGFGRPFGTSCAPGPTLLLGDWGLAGFDEGQECYLAMGDGCPNAAYYGSTQKAYRVGGRAKGNAASVFARSVVGRSPIDENQFWFSFRGEESEFLECVPPTAGEGPNKWETTPGLNSPVPEYNDGYLARGNCALGWPQDPRTGLCPDRGW